MNMGLFFLSLSPPSPSSVSYLLLLTILPLPLSSLIIFLTSLFKYYFFLLHLLLDLITFILLLLSCVQPFIFMFAVVRIFFYATDLIIFSNLSVFIIAIEYYSSNQLTQGSLFICSPLIVLLSIWQPQFKYLLSFFQPALKVSSILPSVFNFMIEIGQFIWFC